MTPPISRRCSICAINWPDTNDFKYCPACGEDTGRIRDIVPIDADDARSRKLHAEFERFYEKWDSTQDPGRLLSEAANG